MVTMGMRAARNTCRTRIRIGETPLPCAVRTKSWLWTSRSEDRAVRMMGAASAKPSTNAGNSICWRLSEGSSWRRANPSALGL